MKVTNIEDVEKLTDGNRVIGHFSMTNSSINFIGKNNIVFFKENVNLTNTSIIFNADNSIVFFEKGSYTLSINMYNRSVASFGGPIFTNPYIKSCITVAEAKNLFVGRNSIFSFGLWMRTCDAHLIYDISTKKRTNHSKSIYIGDNVWIGQAASIFKGVEIQSGSIIGASSVISNKKIPSYTSWAGNPAKQIRDNVTWMGTCSHEWESELSNKSDFIEDLTIYEYDSGVFIPFEEIEKKLTGETDVNKKLDYLIELSNISSPSRFVKIDL